VTTPVPLCIDKPMELGLTGISETRSKGFRMRGAGREKADEAMLELLEDRRNLNAWRKPEVSPGALRVRFADDSMRARMAKRKPWLGILGTPGNLPPLLAAEFRLSPDRQP
jgi:hypothetical protein